MHSEAAAAAASTSGNSSSVGGSFGSSPSAASLEQHLYTSGCPPVDLLVRTSGETRLSDFLLWQSRHALLIFTPVLWPDFGFLDLVAAIMQFQRHWRHLQRLRGALAGQEAAAAVAAAEAAAAAPTARSRLQQPSHQQGCPEQAEIEVHEAQRQQQEEEQQQQGQHIRPVKVAVQELRQYGSPCSVASPASPSSPSSRSEASAEEVMAASETAAATDAVEGAAEGAALGPGCQPAALLKRHAVAAAAAGAVL